MPVTEKRCPRCEQVLPAAHFSIARSRSDGLHWMCRGCSSSYAKARVARDPEKHRAYDRAWYLANKHRIKRKAGFGRTRKWRLGCQPKPFSWTIDESTGCHEWRGAKQSRGYGMYSVGGKNKLAHRFAWERDNGPIPSGLFVCHKCDNRACVNTAHMFLGTARDNTADMIAKGRSRPPRGESTGSAKLTEDQVREIRRMARDRIPYDEIARRFGVCGTHARAIAIGLKWRHVEGATG